MAEDEPIYDAALAAGVQLPIACAYGGCITCAAKMISGKVRQPKGTALNKRQSQAGYILLCVAPPVEDCEIDKSNIMLLGPTGSGKVGRFISKIYVRSTN